MGNPSVTKSTFTLKDQGNGILGTNNPPAPVESFPLAIDLTTAGRIGFYIDYSELATNGTHKFYAIRTHGSAGAVTVSYQSSGDTHTVASGILSWADGETDIKQVDVVISAGNLTTHDGLGLGEHRILMNLSLPTGGVVLHDGTHTRAIGVVDNATMIASDANAVFYDSAAVGGTGTFADPYDSEHTAMTNMGSKRYFYGKGTTTVDTTRGVSIAGSPTVFVLPVPTTRANEAARAYVRNWPGETWRIQGTGTTRAGFWTESGEDYHTYKGIDFADLNASSSSNCFGIQYRYGDSEALTIEHCTADNINGATGTNNSAFAPWGVISCKVWRCTTNNIQTAGDNTNANTAGVQTYLGQSISVQRCDMSLSAQGIYQKQTILDEVSISARFNFLNTTTGVFLGISGGGDPSHSYTIIQNNVFKDCTDQGISHTTTYDDLLLGTKHAWSSNVFDGCGSGEAGAINFNEAFNAQIYNNIMLDCRRVWREQVDSDLLKIPGVEYADYNHDFGTTFSQTFAWRGIDYSSAAALASASLAASGYAELEGNFATSDPLFTAPLTNDYTLQGGSPCIGTGVDGTDKGIFLTGVEIVGAA